MGKSKLLSLISCLELIRPETSWKRILGERVFFVSAQRIFGIATFLYLAAQVRKKIETLRVGDAWFSAQSRRIYFKERNEGKPNLDENKTTKSLVESEPEKPITEQLSTAKFMATGKVLSQTPSIDLTIDAKTWLGTSSSARVEQKVTAPQHDAVVDVSEKD